MKTSHQSSDEECDSSATLELDVREKKFQQNLPTKTGKGFLLKFKDNV